MTKLSEVLAAMAKDDGWRTADAARELEHCAQSIEYSVTGFPELKNAAFRATAGRLAARVFLARNRLGHDVTAPIPGAPATSLTDVAAAQARFSAAIAAFARCEALQPHFAYGNVDKADYERLQVLHVLDHFPTLLDVEKA